MTIDIDPILAVAVNFHLSSVVALIAGIFILIRPSLLSFIVAVYLIVVGITGLLGI